MTWKRQDFAPLRERIANDYKLGLIAFLAATAFVFVTPFAVFRLLEGSYAVGITDLLIVGTCIGAAVYAWRTGETRVPGTIIAIVLATGAAVVAMFVQMSGALWVYPVVMFIFYLTQPLFALILAVLALLSIALLEMLDRGSFFPTTLMMASYFVSATTAALFSFIFALHSNRQREQLMRWATRDPLTGLYNRRHLDEELRIALATRNRYGTRYGLMILDLDNFKTINDQAGHAAGDQILKDLAALIKTHTREEDRAFRYGGDEFVVLLPNTDADGLHGIARNLVRAIEEHLRFHGIRVTASLGAALLLPDENETTWNQRADRCLYSAKELGRNRAVVDDGSGPDR